MCILINSPICIHVNGVLVCILGSLSILVYVYAVLNTTGPLIIWEGESGTTSSYVELEVIDSSNIKLVISFTYLDDYNVQNFHHTFSINQVYIDDWNKLGISIDINSGTVNIWWNGQFETRSTSFGENVVLFTENGPWIGKGSHSTQFLGRVACLKMFAIALDLEAVDWVDGFHPCFGKLFLCFL